MSDQNSVDDKSLQIANKSGQMKDITASSLRDFSKSQNFEQLKNSFLSKKEQAEIIEKDLLKTVLLKCNYQWDSRLNTIVKEGVGMFEKKNFREQAN